MSAEHMTVKVGDVLPWDLPDDGDGTPHTIPMVVSPVPLEVVLPADISPAHELAITEAGAGGQIHRLICLQGHQRLIMNEQDATLEAYLPMLQCSIYLKGPGGPIHRPLHWLAVTNVTGWGDPWATELRRFSISLARTPRKGMPCHVVVTGRDRKVLAAYHLAMHNSAAMVWCTALRRSCCGDRLQDGIFGDIVAQSEADLLPTAERTGCMRPSMPVAIGGQHKAIRGSDLQPWLIEHGWLHQKQVPGDEGEHA